MRKLFFSLFAIASCTVLSAQQTPQPDSLHEYTGKYTFPEGSPVAEVTITIQNGILYATSAMGNSEFRKIEKDVFEVVAYSGTATFKRSAEAKVNGVKIEVDDLILEGTKSEPTGFQHGDKLKPIVLK